MRPHCFEDDPWSPDLLRPDPADARRYGDLTAVHRELARLGDLRTDWRNTRRSITELWIVALGVGVVMLATGWWWLSVPAAGLVLFAVQLVGVTDTSSARGRELDADIATWKAKRQEMLGGGEER